MHILRLNRLLEFLADMQWVMAMFWLGLAIFTVGLAVLLYTRWGRYKPLRKCMAMSLLAHLILASYATTIEIMTPIPRAEQVISLSIGDGPTDDRDPAAIAVTNEKPWEVFPHDTVAQPVETNLDRVISDPRFEPERLTRTDDPRLPGNTELEHVALAEAQPLAPGIAVERSQPSKSAEAIEAPPAQRRDARPVTPAVAVSPERLADDSPVRPVRASTENVPTALLHLASLPRASSVKDTLPQLAGVPRAPLQAAPFPRVADNATADGSDGRTSPPSLAGLSGKRSGNGAGDVDGTMLLGSAPAGMTQVGIARNRADGRPAVPNAYRLRVAPNRAGVAQNHGGTMETEAAVKAALKWLADNQAADGHWNAKTHGAGNATNVLGRDRQNAGGTADSAMTGLALLAFLASGHTHLDGPYREDVRRGLEHLMQIQAADGNLGGQAAPFEFMYCHAMAACALSEAYGMTRDERLREPVRRAIAYTVAAQDPIGGGWRYQPGDSGDTSQLGWQLMSLKSAELAGISTPNSTRQGIIRYLRSVSSGKHGGRASYRPNEKVTRSMTAEALVCWQFLGLPRQHPACDEAGDYLLSELPDEGTYNLYYWYYATLGMYQLQGIHWQRWNDALREALVSRQVQTGPKAGSWDTDDLWGGHGGRVYTTALATLTLEVYYRFLPLYAEVAPDEG